MNLLRRLTRSRTQRRWAIFLLVFAASHGLWLTEAWSLVCMMDIVFVVAGVVLGGALWIDAGDDDNNEDDAPQAW